MPEAPMFDTPEELLHQDWTGDCYGASMAWIATVEEDDWIVVHGTVGKRINHAWCECGGLVVDLAMPVGARITEREEYYRVIKVEVSKVYSSDDALIVSIKTGHNGPWDE